MARPLRLQYQGALYHVTGRGNERKDIYFSEADYQKFLFYVLEVKKRYGIIVHSYVLMTNHYHLLIETPKANLSRVMHHINGAYVTYINIKKERNGHLFQGRYKSIVVEKDSYLLELSRYIHLNPVRAGIAERPEDYPYSSYLTFLSDRKDDLVSRDLILSAVADQRLEAQKLYRAYIEAALAKGLESPVDKAYGGMLLGSKGFIKETLKNLKKEHLNNVDLSHRGRLRTPYEFEEILELIAKRYLLAKNDITTGVSAAAKKTAIYLIKRHTGLTNKEIGERFGGLSYSAVAKVCRRLKKEMDTNSCLKKSIVEIDQALSNVKG